MLAVISVEWMKWLAQARVRVVIAACAVAPILFVTVIRLQSTVPEDTLFGRSVKESGFATPLVVLSFATLWVLPVLASLFGGDVFASEDRFGTWSMVLTRSCSRTEIFVGKLLSALSATTVAILLLAVSSVLSGVVMIGHQSLLDLSGVFLPAGEALRQTTLAWVSVLPPSLALTSLAVLTAVATRNAITGIGVPIVVALLMQLYAVVDGPPLVRQLMITSSFEAWHGLMTDARFFQPLVRGTTTCAVYFSICAWTALAILRRRDIAE